MIATELRGLLERVEKHGGPVKVVRHVDDYSDEWVVRWPTPPRIPPRDTEWAFVDNIPLFQTDQIVGVLKRDLIERGAYEVYSGLSASDYVKGVNTTVGGVAKVEFGWADPFFGEGDTELEATLKAWVAAAEAEGWTA